MGKPAVRYQLDRSWPGDFARDVACWIMLNPSSATETKDDPTIRRCIAFSKRLGFRQLTVVNLYPFRTKDPRKCQCIAEELGNDLVLRHDEQMMINMEIVAEEANAADTAIAAWGSSAWDPGWIYHMTVGIEKPLYCLGTTKAGAPRHPLYVRGDQGLVEWRNPLRPGAESEAS